MTHPGSSDSPGESTLETACRWFMDFNEGVLDLSGKEKFHQWLCRSPEHVRAYIEIAAAWEDAGQLSPPRTAELEALISSAAAADNVVELNRGTPLASWNTRGPVFGRAGFVALAASVVCAVAGLWIYGQRNVYATATGEQRSITLTDGSTVVLNSRSRLEVRFTGNERAVELLDGQALFQVRKDVARPFIVSSQGTRVRAVGTQFDVYRRAAATTVTVIEGRVSVVPSPSAGERSAQAKGSVPSGREAVHRRGSSSGTIRSRERSTLDAVWEGGTADELLLGAGEQLIVGPPVPLHPIRVDVGRVTAWTQRKLIFDDTPLAQVVAEFNRYNTRQIVIEDPALAAFHINGSFQAADPERLVEFLRARFGVRVTGDGREMRIDSR